MKSQTFLLSVAALALGVAGVLASIPVSANPTSSLSIPSARVNAPGPRELVPLDLMLFMHRSDLVVGARSASTPAPRHGERR